MCFAKQLFLLFLVNHKKLLAVLAKCLKNYLHLNYYFYYILDFQEQIFLRTPTSFTHPFMVTGLGITWRLTRWQRVVLLILFTFLGCLRLPESSIKILCSMMLMRWNKSLDPTLCGGLVPGLGPEIMSVFK